jgi:hypothetical protein
LSEQYEKEKSKMAAITRIAARVRTGNRNNAGTNGHVYLGIGGREFYLDSSEEDFRPNDNPTYVLGDAMPGGTPVRNAARNDPRVDYVLVSENLDKFPVYIRFDPAGGSPDWNLESVAVTVYSQATTLAIYTILGGSNNLWLGTKIGKYCYLLKV